MVALSQDALQQAKNESQDAVKQIQSQLSQTQGDLQQRNLEMESLRKELDIARTSALAEENNSAQQLSRLQEELQSCQEESKTVMAQLHTKFAELETSSKELENLKSSLESDLMEKNNRVQGLEDQLKKALEESATAKTSAQDSTDNLQAELAAKVAALKAAEEQLLELRQKTTVSKCLEGMLPCQKKPYVGSTLNFEAFACYSLESLLIKPFVYEAVTVWWRVCFQQVFLTLLRLWSNREVENLISFLHEDSRLSLIRYIILYTSDKHVYINALLGARYHI